jgi:hypothetical protein
MPVILAILEVKMSKIVVGDQPRKIVCKIPSPKQSEQNGLEVWHK